MAIVSKPYTFSAGASIIASEHNSNFDTLYNDYNGNITNANISNSAAISYSKLNLATSIVNADVSASAAIVDTKLATISTAGKVSGAALDSLASIPSGAGSIPSANLVNATGKSNVLFNFSGAHTQSFHNSSSVAPVSPTRTFSGWCVESASFIEVIQTKWTKIAGVSTVKFMSRTAATDANGTEVKVDIGGQNATVSTAATALTWSSLSSAIDVSGLSNGTEYTVSVYLRNSDASPSGSARYLYSTVIMGI